MLLFISKFGYYNNIVCFSFNCCTTNIKLNSKLLIFSLILTILFCIMLPLNFCLDRIYLYNYIPIINLIIKIIFSISLFISMFIIIMLLFSCNLKHDKCLDKTKTC